MAVPFEVEEIDHVVLRCHDQDRMLDFYVRILGLTEERRLEAIGLIQLRAGRSLVDLVPDAGGVPREHPNVDHLCLAIATSDLDEVVRYLARAGVEHDRRADGALRSARVRAVHLLPRSRGERRRAQGAERDAADGVTRGGRPSACLGQGALLLGRPVTTHGARVAELADARDLGSRGQPWGFESPLSHCP